MRLHLLTLLALIASCGKRAPERTFTVIAQDRETLMWISDACDNGRIYSSTRLVDHTLPPEMSILRVTRCAQMFEHIVDGRVEVQSGIRGVCAVRIGPSLATAGVDASSVARLFEDKQLGARIGAAIGPAPLGPTHRVFGMVDGIRVALNQTETTRGLLFYLVLDGCMHGPDTSPGMSRVD